MHKHRVLKYPTDDDTVEITCRLSTFSVISQMFQPSEASAAFWSEAGGGGVELDGGGWGLGGRTGLGAWRPRESTAGAGSAVEECGNGQRGRWGLPEEEEGRRLASTVTSSQSPMITAENRHVLCLLGRSGEGVSVGAHGEPGLWARFAQGAAQRGEVTSRDTPCSPPGKDEASYRIRLVPLSCHRLPPQPGRRWPSGDHTLARRGAKSGAS